MVLKSCDKKSTAPAAAATTVTASAAGSSVESGVERLPKDVTVNGGIHVNAVISTQNATSLSGNSADASSSDDVTDKHVKTVYFFVHVYAWNFFKRSGIFGLNCCTNHKLHILAEFCCW